MALSACAGASGQARIGSSDDVDLGVDEAPPAEEPAKPAEANDEPVSKEDGEEHEKEEPREAAIARTALHQSSPPENHMGLVMAVSERASDLPWVLAVENRSPNPIKLAALPSLLSAEITPVAPPELEGKTTKEPEVITCGGKNLPSSLSTSDSVELGPGQLIFHSFDPRELCDSEEPLKEGAKVKLSYGFPTQTKKLWKNGKLTTVEVEQTAPFVAEREGKEGDEIVPLKHLKAEEFTLGETYPLSKVTALPSNEEDDADAPKKPLELYISNLGTSSAPEQKVVEVRVRNTTNEKMTLLLRRELFTYEVMGPGGGGTCKMHPAARHPAPSAFSTLGPGESRTLQTRLAEACPSGTWAHPGSYAVAALYQSTVSGEEHGLNAFTGQAATTTSARLVVPGDSKSRPKMMIVASQPAQ